STYSFKVTYSDNVAVDVSTIDSSDVVVTGPAGYSAPATLVSLDSTTNGKPRVATYKIAAPAGGWSLSNSGTFTVTLQGAQVRDTSANAASGGAIGTFNATITPPDFVAPVVAGVVHPAITSAGASADTLPVTY